MVTCPTSIRGAIRLPLAHAYKGIDHQYCHLSAQSQSECGSLILLASSLLCFFDSFFEHLFEPLHLIPVYHTMPRKELSLETRAEAAGMRLSGSTFQEIATTLSLPISTVQGIVYKQAATGTVATGQDQADPSY
ncbi:unnamed protein product [Mortierella alpina]